MRLKYILSLIDTAINRLQHNLTRPVELSRAQSAEISGARRNSRRISRRHTRWWSVGIARLSVLGVLHPKISRRSRIVFRCRKCRRWNESSLDPFYIVRLLQTNNIGLPLPRLVGSALSHTIVYNRRPTIRSINV